FAITAGAFVPMNFIAVRLSTAYLHPRVLGSTSNLPAKMAFTFVVSLLAMALLYATLCKYELTAKNARAQLRALRRLAERRAGAGQAAQTPPPRRRSAAPSPHAPATSSRPAAAKPGGARARRC